MDDSPCPWQLHASVPKGSNSFLLRNMGDMDVRTCGGLPVDRAPTQFIAKHLLDKLRDNPSYKPSNLVKDIDRELKVKVPYK